MEDIDFVQQSIKLSASDAIFLYTDGVTEALNVDNELYDEKNCLNRVDKNLSTEDLLKTIRDDMSIHVGDAAQSDDITILVLKINSENNDNGD